MLINLVSDVFPILHGQFAHTHEMYLQLTRYFSICRSRTVIADHGAVQTSRVCPALPAPPTDQPFLPAHPQGLCRESALGSPVVVGKLPEAVFTLERLD